MNSQPLHGFDENTERLAREILDYVLDRIRMCPPLDGPLSPADLDAAARTC